MPRRMAAIMTPGRIGDSRLVEMEERASLKRFDPSREVESPVVTKRRDAVIKDMRDGASTESARPVDTTWAAVKT